MQLCIKQKVFSFRSRFYVKDINGEDRYYIEGELLSIGKKLHVYDMTGTEVAFIAQKVLSFLPRFFVYVQEVQVAEIVKELTLFKQRYTVKGPDWSVQGDFWAHEYDLNDAASTVVHIHKEWLTWGDCYVLDIAPGADEVMALAVVMAIDCVAEQAQAASAST